MRIILKNRWGGIFIATAGECVIAKVLEKVIEAIMMIKDGCDNQATMEKTKLDLKIIEKLRKAVFG